MKHRKWIISLFLVLAFTCAILSKLVGVNYDFADYLPEDSDSKVSLDVMYEEYGQSIPNATIVLYDVSISKALEYKQQIEAVDGVEEVQWLDDVINIYEPLETADEDTVNTWYKENNAKLSVTIDEEKAFDVVTAIREIIGDDNAMAGTAVNSALSYTTRNSSIWNALSNQSSGKVTESNKKQLAEALTSDTITTQLAALPDGELKSGILAYVTAAQNYVAIDEAYQKGLSQYMSTVKGSEDEKTGSAYLASSLKELNSKYKEFDATIQTLESSLSGLAGKMDTLKSSIDTLVTEYSKLDSGITAYADGVSEILSGYSSLVSGVSSLEEGTKELKDGTSQFKEESSGIDDMVDEKIDSMIDSFANSDFETVSFVSEKNTNIDALQFAMVTESIKEPVTEEIAVEEENKSFLQKLIDLF